MTTEKEKMIAGALYRAGDAELVRERATSQALQRRYNNTIVSDGNERKVILNQWLG